MDIQGGCSLYSTALKSLKNKILKTANPNPNPKKKKIPKPKP
jgi:hypothetical protein